MATQVYGPANPYTGLIGGTGSTPNFSNGLALTIDTPFPGTNARPGQYVGAPSASLSGTYSGGNAVSPVASKAVLGIGTGSVPSTSVNTGYGSGVASQGGGISTGGGGSRQLSSLTDEAARNEFGMSLADLLRSNNAAAEQARSAELGRANTQYDYLASQLQNQLSGLDTQKANATNEIDTGLSGVQNQIGLSRTNAQNSTDQQIQQAGSIAKSSQQQNRNVLRALGIINSSAAGELLSKPINEFGKQRAQLQQALVGRFNELDNTLDQATKEAANKKNEILSNYTQLYNNIQNDLRFNDRQRVDALNSINAAASQHLADIQQSVLNYQNQVNLQKQNFAMQMAQISGYQNPNIDFTGINNATLTNSGAGATKTAAIYQDPLKKNALSAV